MSTQITVRLPDALVEAMDEQIRSGAAKSRAAVVQKALARDRRQRNAEKDAEIYAATGEDPELTAWVSEAAKTKLDLD